jgi:hypothetical protein
MLCVVLSIHLSSALWFKYVVKTAITFVASDNELLHAAKIARLKTLDLNNYPDGDPLMDMSHLQQ